MLGILGEFGMSWDDELAELQHSCSEVSCMERGAMQVSEHDIRLPTPHKLDQTRVDLGPDEGHGATGT